MLKISCEPRKTIKLHVSEDEAETLIEICRLIHDIVSHAHINKPDILAMHSEKDLQNILELSETIKNA